MKFLFGVIADELISHEDESYDVKGLRHTLLFDSFPTRRERIVLHACFRAEVADQFQEIDLQVRSVDEQTGDVFTVDRPLVIPEEIDKVNPIIQVEMGLSVGFHSPGRSIIEILVDGEKLAEIFYEALESKFN